jgi:hypothetical protein
MTTETLTRRDVQRLIGEARRYLAAVDVFRSEGCEPAWRREHEPEPVEERQRHRPAIGAPPIP